MKITEKHLLATNATNQFAVKIQKEKHTNVLNQTARLKCFPC